MSIISKIQERRAKYRSHIDGSKYPSLEHHIACEAARDLGDIVKDLQAAKTTVWIVIIVMDSTTSNDRKVICAPTGNCSEAEALKKVLDKVIAENPDYAVKSYGTAEMLDVVFLE